MTYEVIIRDEKSGLLRRDMLRYRTSKVAQREAARLRKLGRDVEVREYLVCA